MVMSTNAIQICVSRNSLHPSHSQRVLFMFEATLQRNFPAFVPRKRQWVQLIDPKLFLDNDLWLLKLELGKVTINTLYVLFGKTQICLHSREEGAVLYPVSFYNTSMASIHSRAVQVTWPQSVQAKGWKQQKSFKITLLQTLVRAWWFSIGKTQGSYGHWKPVRSLKKMYPQRIL